MGDPRLYVIAPNYRHFVAWCTGQGLSPRHRNLAVVLPTNWEQRIRGTDGIRYVTLPGLYEAAPSALFGELSAREAMGRATELTDTEREEWIWRLRGEQVDCRAALLERLAQQTPPQMAGDDRRTHRCDEACVCPADGKPMHYSPATSWHACVDGGCAHAKPKEGSNA